MATVNLANVFTYYVSVEISGNPQTHIDQDIIHLVLDGAYTVSCPHEALPIVVFYSQLSTVLCLPLQAPSPSP